MKSLIYGYGETGKSFERYLKKQNRNFDIFDNNIDRYNKELNLNSYDEIFVALAFQETYLENYSMQIKTYLQI